MPVIRVNGSPPPPSGKQNVTIAKNIILHTVLEIQQKMRAYVT